MNESAAQLLVWILTAYAGFGVLFALWFVWRGIHRIEPSARESSRGFRLIVLPGVAALWPLLALRLARGVSAPPEARNAHIDAAARRPAAGGTS